MDGKRIIFAVSNDLVGDQRVDRAASTLQQQGGRVLLVGRKLPGSQQVSGRKYTVHRMKLLFRKGAFFYACFNIRLFCFLLFRKADLLVANDLDTLPACYCAARIKHKPLVYDSHEYFTEVPELQGRNFTRSIWTGIEKRILPGLKYSSTVSTSIADAYFSKYGIEMELIRNLPYGQRREARRPDLLDCGPKRIIIYQGALNVGRGLETIITAMQYLDAFQLQLFGQGDIADDLHALTHNLKLGDRVEFMGRLPFDKLKSYTRQASLGISLEEDIGLNYRYALPNKLFDYIQAGIPVLVSDLPEMRRIVEDYGIGQVVDSPDPELLAAQIRKMMESEEWRMEWKTNLRKAASELCWEKEQDKVLDLYGKALKS